MSNPPVCHIPVDQTITDQPRPARFAPIPPAVDLKSALVAVNALRLIIQQLTGQIAPPGIQGLLGIAGARGAAGAQGAQGSKGPAGKEDKTPKDAQWVEDTGQRVTKKIKVYQDNDKTSSNWVEISRIDRVVWVDRVTSAQIVWARGNTGD